MDDSVRLAAQKAVKNSSDTGGFVPTQQKPVVETIENVALDNEVRIDANKSVKNSAEIGDRPQFKSQNCEMLGHKFQESATHTTM